MRIDGSLKVAGMSVVLAGSLVACGGEADPQESAATTAPVESAIVSLDFSELRSDGLCEDGSLRPCYQPLRTAPNRDSTTKFVNPAVRTAASILCAAWPYEADRGTGGSTNDQCPSNPEGDDLKVVCQVIGAVTINSRGEESEIWNVYEIPPEHRISGGPTHAYGPKIWAPETPKLDACTPAENPANAPLA